MKKKSLRFFALTLIFVCVAVVFFTKSDLSAGKFLLFFLCGAASGASLTKGIASLPKTK